MEEKAIERGGCLDSVLHILLNFLNLNAVPLLSLALPLETRTLLRTGQVHNTQARVSGSGS